MNDEQRSKIVLKILNKTYPKTPIPLKHKNTFTLLISVTLSAQTTDLNVNNVLDEIRPYIEADGGYLEYISIDYLDEGPIVMVRMLGACAGCAMSAQTMTMGIEKLVKEKFPEVKRVISV